MPDISDDERAERQRAIDFAPGSVQLSGGELTPETEALNARYVAGELSDSEHTEAVLACARALRAGEPTPEYVTSFDEVVPAAPGR